MTDRELLELAAKAAGIPLIEWAGCYRSYWTGENYWNPLIDNGDAFKLVVMLDIEIHPYHQFGEVNTAFMVGDCGHGIVEEFGNDDYAATRRAIVRSAADIGASKCT